MTNVKPRHGDWGASIKDGHEHKRKVHHKRRPCGGNTPSTPAGLTFTWTTAEKHRHQRIAVLLNWNEVTTTLSGGKAKIDRYLVQMEHSSDGVNGLGEIRRFTIAAQDVDFTAISGQVSTTANSKQVVGTGTSFTGQLNVGDRIRVGVGTREFRYVASIADNTHLATTANFDQTQATVNAGKYVLQSVSEHYVKGVRKHLFYRFRVLAINNDHCRSNWSDWTSWTLANDHTPPPAPLNVKIFNSATNRIVMDWDEALVYNPIEGTATNSASSAAVVGVGTFFQTQIGPGDHIKLGTEIQTVLSITDDTHLTTQVAFTNAHAAVVPFIEDTDPDIAYFQTWIGTTVGFTPPAYKLDRYVHATKKGIKVADADEGGTFYARVRSVDASGNRSNWIPATIAGNSSPGTTPDGIFIGRGGAAIVATFSKAGRLRVKHYSNKRWTNPTDVTLYLKRARLTVGDKEAGTGAPTGSAVKMNLRRWLADESAHAPVFDNGAGADRDDRLTVGAGTYKDTTNPNDFDINHLLNGEELSVKVTQVGSGFPGDDFTLQVYMSTSP